MKKSMLTSVLIALKTVSLSFNVKAQDKYLELSDDIVSWIHYFDHYVDTDLPTKPVNVLGENTTRLTEAQLDSFLDEQFLN